MRAVCSANPSHKTGVDYVENGMPITVIARRVDDNSVFASKVKSFCDVCGAVISLARDCPKSTGDISSCNEGCAINGCPDYEDGKADYEPPLPKDSE